MRELIIDNNKSKFLLLVFFTLGLLLMNMNSQNLAYPIEGKPDYLFSVHMIAPTSNPVRMQFAQLIEQEITKIGIGTELDLISWAALGPRCTDQEVGMYSEGGYDISFFGMSLGSATGHPGNSLQVVFGSGAIPPAGFNVPYWSPETGKGYNNYRAQESDDLITQINSNLDVPSAIGDLCDWQKIWYDAMPNIIIYNQYEVQAISSILFGYDPVIYPLGSIEDQWFTDTSQTVVLATATGPNTFNSIQATDIYSQYSATVPMDGLVGYTPSKQIVLPTGTNRDTWMTDKYGTTDHLALYPRMATSLGAYSADGLQFNITVRDDIYWHDGHLFDAWDVAFSFQARLVPEIGASVYSNLLVPFGTDDKTTMSGNYSFVVEDKDSDSFFESISFQFVNKFAPWTTDYLGSLIYPEHILGDHVDHGFDGSGDFDVTQWAVLPGDWSTHSTSTGRTTDTGGYAGPIGTGSMIFKSYDAGTGIVSLEKFKNVRWSGSEWIAETSNNFYNIVNLVNMPSEAKLIISSFDDAIAGMKTEYVNIIDPQFTLSYVLEELQASPVIQTVLSPETGWQAMYMNPKFVQDGVYHFQKKGVRHALSHVIPRNDIIQYLMNDLGLPGYTPIPITSRAAIPEADMLTYKKTLEATDGSKPEAYATTAYDTYDLGLAFDWLDTEGYDTSEWRSYTPPILSIWYSPDAQQWDSRIQAGYKIEFKIEKVRTNTSSSSWYWEAADIVFHQGDTIEITWNSDPLTDEIVGNGGSVTYDISTKVGGITLDSDHSKQLGFFILPLITTDGFGRHESGIRAAERFFFNSFQLLHSPLPVGQYTWTFSVDNASLSNTGGSSPQDGEINAHIVTHDYFETLNIESRVFNLTYDAQWGMLNKLIFTNIEGGNSSTGIVESPIISGLSELVITRDQSGDPLTYVIPLTTATTQVPTSTTTTRSVIPTTTSSPLSETSTSRPSVPELTPALDIPLVIGLVLLISIKRRKD